MTTSIYPAIIDANPDKIPGELIQSAAESLQSDAVVTLESTWGTQPARAIAVARRPAALKPTSSKSKKVHIPWLATSDSAKVDHGFRGIDHREPRLARRGCARVHFGMSAGLWTRAPDDRSSWNQRSGRGGIGDRHRWNG